MDELEDLSGMCIHKTPVTTINKQNSGNGEKIISKIFKALMRETTVYKQFVKLKEGVFTEQGYLDLAKVPDLYVSGAGQFLRNLRQKNGLRQKDIAKIIGVCCASVNHWEKNSVRINLRSLVKIAEGLGSNRGTIYSLIDQGEFNTKNKLPANFEKIRTFVQYFNLHNDKKARITLLKCCPDEMRYKIKETLNVKLRSHGCNWKIITSRELYNFLKTFFCYTKVPKIHPPLSDEVKGWYEEGVDLKRAVIIPCLQSDGAIIKCMRHYLICLFGYNRVLHDCFVDAMYYEYNELPSTYFARCYQTAYFRKPEIRYEIMNLAGNTKTSPARGQTIEEYLKEAQPHINYLINASKTEQQISLRIWASTEGSISVHRTRKNIYPFLMIACAHPHLATQLQQIARRFKINFYIRRQKDQWSGIDGLATSAISSCINFLKLGGFIKGVKIGATSKYHEGIDKDVLLLGILEFKTRELENSHLINLPIQQIHHEINRIVNNREYRSAGYYINYFS